MAVQLGQTSGLAQFTPELQHRLFERGVNGIDITNGIPRREPNPEYVERMKTLENVYNMVQNGDLVPKQTIQYQAPVQPTQHAPVQVQNEIEEKPTQASPTDDFMKMLFPENNVVDSQPQVHQQTTPVTNEQPKIDWDKIVVDQQNMLIGESVKHGIKGEDVVQWMGQLTPADYVELFKKYNPATEQATAKQHYQERYVPSIADMPSANITTVKQERERVPHPLFG